MPVSRTSQRGRGSQRNSANGSASCQRQRAHRSPQSFVSLTSTAPSAPMINNNIESDLRRRFPDKLPSNIWPMNNACASCGSLHWKRDRTQSNMNKELANYSICCRKGAVVLPVQYTNNVSMQVFNWPRSQWVTTWMSINSFKVNWCACIRLFKFPTTAESI